MSNDPHTPVAPFGTRPNDDHLIERRIDGNDVYRGKLLHVKSDRVRLPDGNEATREYIEHPGAALIIPILPDGRLLMERQFRYAVGRVLIEFPAGKLDPGEDMLKTAQRELLEETGYRAEQWEWIAEVHPIVSYTTERIEVFLATGLTLERQKLDPGEFLELIAVDFADVFARMKAGEVSDLKTIFGLYVLKDRGFG
jgi:ADP-ribose pyrophosphatase